ncbi:hypothetical protein BGX27_010356 [Mortierella sp. AM989]|nr:hypothetical protein BGX27_010356 [Mortierella sp. AM989]
MSLLRVDVLSTPPELDLSIPITQYLSVLKTISQHIHHLQQKARSLILTDNTEMVASELTEAPTSSLVPHTKALKLAEDLLDMSMVLALRFCKVRLVLLSRLPSFQQRFHRVILGFFENEASSFMKQLQGYCNGGTLDYWQTLRPLKGIDNRREMWADDQEQQCPRKDFIGQRPSLITQSQVLHVSSAPAPFHPKSPKLSDTSNNVSASLGFDTLSLNAARLQGTSVLKCDTKTVIPPITITVPTPPSLALSTQSTSTSSTSSVAIGVEPIASGGSNSHGTRGGDSPKSSVQHLIERFSKSPKRDTIESRSVDGVIQAWRHRIPPVVSPLVLPTANTALGMNGDMKPSSFALGFSFASSRGAETQIPFDSPSADLLPPVDDKNWRDNGKTVTSSQTNILNKKVIQNKSYGQGAYLEQWQTMHAEEQMLSDIIETRTNMTLNKIFGKDPMPDYGNDGNHNETYNAKTDRLPSSEINQAKFTKEYKEDEYMTFRNSRTFKEPLYVKQSTMNTWTKPTRLFNSPSVIKNNGQSMVKSIVHRLNGAHVESPMLPSALSSSRVDNGVTHRKYKSVAAIAVPRPSSTSSLVGTSLSVAKGETPMGSGCDTVAAEGSRASLLNNVDQHYGSIYGDDPQDLVTTSLTNSAQDINGTESTESDDTDSDDGSLQYLDVETNYEADEWLQGKIESETNKDEESEQNTTSSSSSLPLYQQGQVQSPKHGDIRCNDRSNSCIRVADAVKSIEEKYSISITDALVWILNGYRGWRYFQKMLYKLLVLFIKKIQFIYQKRIDSELHEALYN